MAAKQVQMKQDGEPGGTHKPETGERCWGKQQRITASVMGVRGERLVSGTMDPFSNKALNRSSPTFESLLRLASMLNLRGRFASWHGT